MRILFVNPRFPYPADNGEKIRSYYLLKGLAQRHEVDLVAFSGGDETPEAINHLRSFCRQVYLVPSPRSAGTASTMARFLRNLPSLTPWLVAGFASRTMQELLVSLVKAKRYDVLQFELLWLAQYAPALRPYCQGSIISFTDHNIEAEIYRTMAAHGSTWTRRFYSWLEEKRVWRYERRTWSEMDLVLGVSERDTDTIRRHTDRPVHLASLGVDTEYLVPGHPVEEESDSLVFVGGLYYPPNADAVDQLEHEVLPRVRKQIPSVKAYVVGQGRPPGESLTTPGLFFTGHVPDIRPWVRRASVFVAPIRMGGGIRVKVLEAMAMGKAIVATPLGAGGINYVDGRDLFIAGDMETFAERVVQLCRDHALRHRLGLAARTHVSQHYSWDRMVLGLEAKYTEVATSLRQREG